MESQVQYYKGVKRVSRTNLTCDAVYWRLKRQKLVYAFQAEFKEQRAKFGDDYFIHRETIVRDILMKLLGLTYAESSRMHKQSIGALLELINGGPFVQVAIT